MLEDGGLGALGIAKKVKDFAVLHILATVLYSAPFSGSVIITIQNRCRHTVCKFPTQLDWNAQKRRTDS